VEKRPCYLAHGSIVNDEAPLTAMANKRMTDYGCDAPNPALLEHPQILMLPYLGVSTEEAAQNCAVMIAALVTVKHVFHVSSF
jgi:D-3-phosphoglycerate dehydrogenase